MTHFFISYAKADERWATWIHWVLENEHYEVESQRHDFKPGENFMRRMQEVTERAERTILVLSPAYLESGFAMLEAATAVASDPIGRKRKAIPVLVQPCDVPKMYRQIIYIDLVGLDEQSAREALVNGTADEQQKPEKRPPFPGRSSLPTPFPGETTEPAADRERVKPTQDRHDVDAEGFLKNFDFDDVESIHVSALTGGMTVRAVVNRLRRANPPPGGRRIPLQILVKARELSDRKRANDVAITINDLKTLPAWVEPEVRFFSAPAVLRSIIMRHENSSYTAFLSFYDWKHPENLPNRGAHSDYASARVRSPSDRLLEVYESWFQHYWGRKKLHTIVFDFDDTLFFTTKARVTAWCKAISQGIADKRIARSDLSKTVQAAYDEGKLEKALTDIFFEKQEDDDMLDLVFKKAFVGEKRRSFVELRRKLRADETALSAEEIPDIAHCLPLLRNDYQLVIVSGTSESVVENVLTRHRLTKYFSFVVGSEAPTQNWESIERKTQNLLRISTMLGVPLKRCAFIGDSDTDYRSARQLDLPFIENRLNTLRLNKPSLIRNPAGDLLFIAGQGGADELFHLLDKIDMAIDWRGEF